ncbi:Rpp14/Pop5 family protein [Halorutilales archaeon Cl-col2-1]
MKRLPKSLEPRHRYVFFEVETLPNSGKVDEKSLERQIWFESQNLFGDIVSSEARAELIEYDPPVGVVRCAHDRVDEIRSALACVTSVEGEDVGVRVVGVSGTLNSGREKFSKPDWERVEVEDDGVTRVAWKSRDRLDFEAEETDEEGTVFIGATVHDFK